MAHRKNKITGRQLKNVSQFFGKPSQNAQKVVPIIASVLAIAIMGVHFIFTSQAATFATSSEAESGVVSGNASVWNGAEASGGQAVKFGNKTLAVSVSGNHLVNQNGKTVQLIGLNRGTLGCSKGNGIFSGPVDEASFTELDKWNINAMRIPLNEDCWLGINGSAGAASGANYRTAIENYISLLNAHGMYVIVNLHFNAPGSNLSITQQPMADADHALTYWTSVANSFKDNPAVIFEPYNEPDITTADSNATDAWNCWLHGCTVNRLYSDFYNGTYSNLQWQTTGMQQIVNAIRDTGATNVITLSGLATAHDLSGLLANLPTDPQHQLAATFHNYQRALQSPTGCGPSCWDTTIASVAAQIPVLTDELGQTECQANYSDYVTQYMNWADAHGVSYFPWGWFVYNGDNGCTNNHFYSMLTNLNGTPNFYGQVFYNYFNAK